MYKLNADDKLEPYQSPISPKQFGRLSGNLLIVAIIIKNTKMQRNLKITMSLHLLMSLV